MTDTLVERVKKALHSHKVIGVVYPDDAGSCYRVQVSGTHSVIGGDHVDLESAQALCDELNAHEAIKAQASRIAELEEALRMVRPFAPPDTDVARAVSKALGDKTPQAKDVL